MDKSMAQGTAIPYSQIDILDETSSGMYLSTRIADLTEARAGAASASVGSNLCVLGGEAEMSTSTNVTAVLLYRFMIPRQISGIECPARCLYH